MYETRYPTLVGAKQLHQMGIDGRGVTVAVLDSGLWDKSWLIDNDVKGFRVRAQYDVVRSRTDSTYRNETLVKGKYQQDINDDSGHGSHVTSIILSNGKTSSGAYNGVAPGVDLVAVRAFDANGRATYADVIAALDWIVAKKSLFNIRVLNLSFSAPVRSHYWQDPLNQAVMAAWKAGIVVVASAGNTGPKPMTIGAPGNVPYIITVGAMTDNNTSSTGDNTLASFSAAGPTTDGFVKPELVAPGGRMLGLMEPNDRLATQHPEFIEPKDGEYFLMSGTFQATGVVSGVAALILQGNEFHPTSSWPT